MSTKEADGEIVLVQKIRVDLSSLRGLVHACEPSRCERASSCCSRYEVIVDRKEQGRITGHLSDASHYAKHLRESRGYMEPFETTEGGRCLATHEDGLCVFAFGNSTAKILCSLHAAAIEQSLPPYSVKPFACSIWPLYFVESDPPLLTVQEGVSGFPCNSTRRKQARRLPRLDAGVSEIITRVWGEAFLSELEGHLARGAPD